MSDLDPNAAYQLTDPRNPVVQAAAAEQSALEAQQDNLKAQAEVNDTSDAALATDPTVAPATFTNAKAKAPADIQAEIDRAKAAFASTVSPKKSKYDQARDEIEARISDTFSGVVAELSEDVQFTDAPEKVLTALKSLDAAKRALVRAARSIPDDALDV